MIQVYSGTYPNKEGSLCQVCAWVLSCSVMSDSLRPPWTVAHQAPLSMGFSRQECWSGLPFPSPGDLPNPGIEPTSPMSLALAGEFFTTGWAYHWGRPRAGDMSWAVGREAEGKVCGKGREACISNDWIKRCAWGSINVNVFGVFLMWRGMNIITCSYNFLA